LWRLQRRGLFPLAQMPGWRNCSAAMKSCVPSYQVCLQYWLIGSQASLLSCSSWSPGPASMGLTAGSGSSILQIGECSIGGQKPALLESGNMIYKRKHHLQCARTCSNQIILCTEQALPHSSDVSSFTGRRAGGGGPAPGQPHPVWSHKTFESTAAVLQGLRR